MRITKKASRRASVQYAALPYRATASSDFEVLLVTSRTTRRWIIPKGWPLVGKPPHATAAREAFEEAGLIGRVTRRPLGSFSYVKHLKSGAHIECKVHVFPMEVTAQRRNWPEKGKREVQWFSTTDAAATIGEPVLRKLIKSFEAVQPSPEPLPAGRRSRG
jgi:8-oxo-dGTP pyrophosphatase MutT (NUDIX family)